jgi:flagellin-like protein
VRFPQISPVTATALLLLITVALAVVLYIVLASLGHP